ncbi:hypothetical protein HanRHA438_Chr00c07g0846941 [Helianthus annuus]|nr:hypothetical protein HanRHA438_Chr00c07g0846941 [Helianthus annuus]
MEVWMIMWFCISWFYMRGISGIKDSRSRYKERLKPKGLDCLESIENDHEFLCKSHKGYNFEWRGVVGWGFGCVFFFASLGILGWVMDWAPQTFLLSVESIDGEVGLWVGGIMGNAVIRSTSRSWVVFWLLQPSFRPLCWVLVFGLIFSWCIRLYITLLMSLFLSECRLNSAFGYWVLGVSRLGMSLCLYWFLSKPVSWFFAESFESDMLGSKGILGSWGWAAVIRRRDFETMLMYLEWQKCRGYVKTDLEWQGHCGNSVKVLKRECWGLDSYLNTVERQIERIWKDIRSYQHCRMLFGLPGLFYSHKKVVFGKHRRLQGYYGKYTSSRINLQDCDGVTELWRFIRAAKLAAVIINWKGYNGDFTKNGYINDGLHSEVHNWYSEKMLIWRGWGLNGYIFEVIRQFVRAWRSNSSCHYCSLLVWMIGAIWKYWKYGNKRQVQTVQKNECNNFDTLEAGGTELIIRDKK